MARVNITVPDDLCAQAKAAGLSVSQLAQAAIRAELARRDRISQLDAYLAELEATLGPTTEQERAESAAWADAVFGPDPARASA